MRDILLSQAIEGFLLARAADGYAPDTIDQYRWGLAKITEHIKGNLADIKIEDLRQAMTAIQGGDLAAQSKFHVWKSIKAFYKWALSEELVTSRPDANLKQPRFQVPEIQPLTTEEIKLLLKSIDRTKPSVGKRDAFTMPRAMKLRDKAIILILLDTGIRASELARLELRDLDLQTGTIVIRPHQSGLKSRGRVIPLGKSVRTAIWRYHTERKGLKPSDPVFATAKGTPIVANALLHLLMRLGDRAGVANVHPHRFRHTFAVQFLRNGGDVFTLQRILGHATLDMTHHYLALAQSDDEAAHRRASPVDNWRL